MFVVKYRGRVAEAWEYAPEGEGYECTAEQSRERFDLLLAMGREGRAVYGIVPTHVRIEDTRISAGASVATGKAMLALGIPAAKNIMLAQYVDDEAAVGPWAVQAVAA